MTTSKTSTPDTPTVLEVSPQGEVSESELAPILAELDLDDSHTVLAFGSSAQEQLTAVSETLLERVRNKDVGPAGEALNEMVLTLRGFDPRPDQGQGGGWLSRLMGKRRDAVNLIQRYDEVSDQIERITDDLERHKTELMVDIEALDRLYAANLDYFHTLERYISAGETRLAELDEQRIPALAEEAQRDGETLTAQRLRDLRSLRDDLERRVHDLRLTRQVTMQSLPSLRLVQENDKGLVGKITSTLVNTVPLWRQQLAQAVTIQRSRDAAGTINAASDLTNDLLRANAENLRGANAEAREQMERGVFDIEAVAEANQTLIAAIEDSLRIADEGRAARARAGAELQALEQQLKESLAAASAREAGGPVSPSKER
jgi:uncharacterized protein YaaN involved in tellurite resistance